MSGAVNIKINRILHRHELVKWRPRKRSEGSFIRFERPGPMQLWGIDLVGGIELPRAEVAEIRFTAFSSKNEADQVPGRLVVRRIPDLNPSPRAWPT